MFCVGARLIMNGLVFRAWQLWGLLLLVASTYGFADQVTVSSKEEFARAFASAGAGDVIVLASGEYSVYRLDTRAGGTASSPIVVRALVPGKAIVRATGIELFVVHHSYWIFRDLVIRGHANAEHAFHISGGGHHVRVLHNVITDFNAHLKINGEPGGFYPDGGVIEDNGLFNHGARNTSSPVTVIDLVAASDWTVRGNFIADFEKSGGNATSYGIFMKGNSARGIIERNLVLCRAHGGGGQRVGISFGGGGTGVAYCRDQVCADEHHDGVIRNNVVLNCSDVGIYLNKAARSQVLNNTVLLTEGIDARFSATSAQVRGNVLTGDVRIRDGGNAEVRGNLSFGNRRGLWLFGLFRRLSGHFDDLAEQNSEGLTSVAVRFPRAALAIMRTQIARSRFGLGEDKTLECFPGLGQANLTPASGCLGLTKDAAMLADDFWGHRRGALTDIGAIDFQVSDGNLSSRMAGSSEDFFSQNKP